LTFQDLLLLRTTHGLARSGVKAARIRRAWSSLRDQLEGDRPLTSLTITCDGERIVATDGHSRWQADSGQVLLELGAEEADTGSQAPAVIARMPARTAGSSREKRAPQSLVASPSDPHERSRAAAPAADPEPATADDWFHRGVELESVAPDQAQQAYRQALALDTSHANAHINLGWHFHEAGELGKAEAHYRDAVGLAPDDPTPHFNLGVLLDEKGRTDEAAYAYRQALVRDPEEADAHYNLGLLLERLGRRAEAMTELLAARELYERLGEGF
jgi:tetratricopeptide (TPR) repeat protein